jgi:hypothetical protein
MIRFLVAFLCLSSIAPAQIELSHSMRKTLVGATNPEVLEGGRILIEGDSQVAESPAALIKVASVEGVRVIAMLGSSIVDLIPVDIATDDASKITTKRYLLVGEGEYTITAISRANEAWDRTAKITIGKPTPKPPKPDDPPLPPEPVKSFRVIFVKESGSTLNSEQTAITGAKAIRDYLSQRTTPEGGLAGWREYDPQQNVANEQSAIKSLWAATKSSITTVPCVVVEVNGKAKLIDYPKNTAEALKTLKEYGGQ